MHKNKWLILAFLAMELSAVSAGVPVSDFANQGIQGWETKEFKGQTQYQVVELDDRHVLHARSQGAASGLIRHMKINLEKTPYLNWSWKLEEPIRGLNEREKSGDDFAARIYVIDTRGILFWRTRAINYVWSSNQRKGLAWPNPFTDQAIMVSVRGKESFTKTWYYERRNVREDFRRYFGEDVTEIDGVAIMSDTDNSGRQTEAFYGKIFFSSR